MKNGWKGLLQGLFYVKSHWLVNRNETFKVSKLGLHNFWYRKKAILILFWFRCQNDPKLMWSISSAKSHFGQCTTSASFTRVGSQFTNSMNNCLPWPSLNDKRLKCSEYVRPSSLLSSIINLQVVKNDSKQPLLEESNNGKIILKHFLINLSRLC